ncbi:MAG: Cmx/CmrA family chloramphenicol efflux MFS transporter [Brevibacterium linens]
MPFALYILALAVFVMGTSEFMLAGLLPAIAAELDVTFATAGLLTSAFAVGMVIGAPLMAAFARRWPPRLALLLCLSAFAGCHILGAVTPVFSLLITARVISALANAGFLAVALSAATALAPAHRKGRALAILLSGTTIAMVVGVPAGALLGTALGWRATFWAIALLCVPAALGVLGGIRGRPEASADDSAAPGLQSELAELRSRRVFATMALGALINGGTFAAFTFLAPVVTDVAGLGDAWISFALVLFGGGSFLGISIAGRLSDDRPGIVLWAGAPLLLVGWVTLALISANPAMLLVLVFVQGALSFGVGSTVISRVLYAASGAPTMGGAYATAALNVGAAAGPVLGALVLSLGASGVGPIWAAAAVTAAAIVIMLLAKPRLEF